MPHLAISLLTTFVLSFDAVMLDAHGAAQATKPPTGACSLLTKDLAMRVSGALNKLVFDMPPEEEPVGKSPPKR